MAGKTETCAALIQVYVAVAKATKFDIGPPTEQVAETLDNLFVLKGAFVDLSSEIFTGKSVSAPGLDQNSVLCSENVVCLVFGVLFGVKTRSGLNACSDLNVFGNMFVFDCVRFQC